MGTTWDIISLKLVSTTAGNTVYWNIQDTGQMPIGSSYALPTMPQVIDYSLMTCLVATSTGEDAQPTYYLNGVNVGSDLNVAKSMAGGGADLFTVLQAPVGPMSIPWDTMDRYACTFAAGCNTQSSAYGCETYWLYFTSGPSSGAFQFNAFFTYPESTNTLCFAANGAYCLSELRFANRAWFLIDSAPSPGSKATRPHGGPSSSSPAEQSHLRT